MRTDIGPNAGTNDPIPWKHALETSPGDIPWKQSLETFPGNDWHPYILKFLKNPGIGTLKQK